ncbi:MAG: hypothetical protein DCF21_21385 [Leptolyngbya sp.]|nr:MAG: hypothetical protein DCF21_21385 [Leptolyngbya sp.]
MLSVPNIFAEYFIGKKELHFNWLLNIPMTSTVIKPLLSNGIKLNSKALPELLVAINQLFITHNTPYARPLLSQEVNRILKVARKENNPVLLRGAFIAISTSRFIKSAGSDLILKLIRGNHKDSMLIDDILFKHRFNRFREIDKDPKEAEVRMDVAQKIINDPDNYAFRLVCSAASHLFENKQLSLSPLIQEEDTLNLKVRKSTK